MTHELRYPSGFVTIQVEVADYILSKPTDRFDDYGYILYIESVSPQSKKLETISDEAVIGIHFSFANNGSESGAKPFAVNLEDLGEYTFNKINPDKSVGFWSACAVEANQKDQRVVMNITFDASHPDFLLQNRIYQFNLQKYSCFTKEKYNSISDASDGHSLKLGGGVFSSRGAGNFPDPNIHKHAIGVDFGNNSSSACILLNADPSPNEASHQTIVHEDSSMSVCKGLLLNDPNNIVPGSHDQRALFYADKLEEHSERNAVRCNIGKTVIHFIGKQTEKDAYAHRSMKRSLAHPRAHDDLILDNDVFDNNFVSRWFDDFGSYRSDQDNRELSFKVPKRIPAELFLTELIDMVSATPIGSSVEKNGRIGTPSNIVLTYPITYGLKEIINFKVCFARAFLRHFNIKQKKTNSYFGNDELGLPEVIGQVTDYKKMIEGSFAVINNPLLNNDDFPVKGMIDEASAAAYFYIKKFLVNRDNFFLNGFLLQYPKGCRIVVIDFGAGTTDVAAFDIDPIFENSDGKMILKKARVKLKKRTGDHHFCGDFVTRQIIRLIKAKVIYANEIGSGNSSRRITNVDSIANNFNGGAGCLSKPSEFVKLVYQHFRQTKSTNATSITLRDLGFLDTENHGKSANHKKSLMALKRLVDISENLKKEFNKETRDDRNPHAIPRFVDSKLIFPTQRGGMRGLESIINDFYPKPTDQDNIAINLVKDRLKNITIHYKEICELINSDTCQVAGSTQNISIGLKNFVEMVKTSVIFPISDEENEYKDAERFVSRVVVTGKGSLFRHITDELSKNLGLLDPDTQLVNLSTILKDPEQLKRCVSIGASWWLSDRNSPSAMIDMDCEELQKVLPYDLIVEGFNGVSTIARVGTRYDKLNDVLSEQIKTANPINQVLLYKRFPGGKKTAFSCYNFPNHVREFKIKWDSEAMDFTIDNAEKDMSFAGDGVLYGNSPLWDGTV